MRVVERKIEHLEQVRYLRFKKRWRWNPRKGISNLAIFMMLILFIVMAFYFTAGQSQGQSAPGREITIEEGDTLWGITLKHFPHNEPRKIIAKIRDLNALQSPTIYNGPLCQDTNFLFLSYFLGCRIIRIIHA